jgi:hypothetical protein
MWLELPQPEALNIAVILQIAVVETQLHLMLQPLQ